MTAVDDNRVSLTESKGRTAYSAATLGFLCLLPVALLILAQAFQIGAFLTVGSSLPASDSNLWASCASALANGDESYNLAWCLRRPLTILAQTPFFVLAPGSMAAVILLQLLAVSAAFWWFLVTISRGLPVGRLGVMIVYVLGLFPVFWYGTYLGPEAPALALSFVSAGAVVRFMVSRRVAWGLLAAGSAIVVLQIRPGNFVLTGVLAIAVLVVTRAAGRRWLVVIGVAAALVALWLLPARVLGVVGWPAAGHASNFWSAAYSAATPEADTWVEAYDRFGPDFGCPKTVDWTPDPCLALESEEFGQFLRDQSLALIRADPMAVPGQAVNNISTFLGDGYLNDMWGHPFTPALQVWQADDRERLLDGWNGVGTFVATLMWLGSLVLVGLLVVRLGRLGKRASPFTRAGDVPDRVTGAALWVGVATVAGAAASFALVGHVEPQRHLVQNIPYILLAIAGVSVAHRRTEPPNESPPATTTTMRRWPLLGVGLLVGVVIIAAIAEGHTTGPTIAVARECGAGTSGALPYDVIASASVDSERPITGPSDWRRLPGADTGVLFADRSWIQQMLGQLPPGQMLDLRSETTGEVVPVFLSDADLSAVGGDWQGTDWCTSSPSKFGVMIVHDLVPMT